jgi:hypothetical protein
MARRYASFLIRCWRLDRGELRIKVEHIQTGESSQVATHAEALAWITSQWVDRPDPPAVTSGDSETDEGGDSSGG